MKTLYLTLSAIIAALALANPLTASAAEVTLLNVSYDPTRELYKDYNAAFAKYWQATTGDKVTVSWKDNKGETRSDEATIA